MSDIFISYAREDRAKAKALAEVFEAQGWSVWWDRDIPAGRSFDQVIEEQIGSAKCIVVLWSAASVASDWVKSEAGEGVARKALVPVRIDATKVPLEFRRLQTVDLCGWDRGESHPEMAGLLDAISGQIRAPVKSVPGGPRWRPSTRLIFGTIMAALLLGAIAFFAMRRTASDSPSQTPEPGVTEITSTRNLRLEFLQDGRPCRMSTATYKNYPVVRVLLKQRPIEIRCEYYESAIQICAWTDDSIFRQIQAGMSIEDVPYFRPGTGMAAPDSGYSALILENRGQHYIVDDRLKKLPDNRASFTFTSAQDDNGTLARWPPRIYLVVLSDVNHPTFVDADEFERVILEFEQ